MRESRTYGSVRGACDETHVYEGGSSLPGSADRSMLYLPPKARRKFKEIAFHEDRKEHDVYIEALREYLERRGHRGLL
jgi:hypothetical protein